MKSHIFILLSFTLTFSNFLQAQSCPIPPVTIKSGTLNYKRLPGIVSPNYRFFYKLTIECGAQPVLNDLYITDALEGSATVNPNSTAISWDLDSMKNTTGVIDPCIVLQTPPCHTTFYYHADAELGSAGNGYVAATVNCCRPFNAVNLLYPYNFNYDEQIVTLLMCIELCYPCIGEVYNGIASYIKIPNLSILNSSPEITSNDTILSICSQRAFSYGIHAEDPDGDSIAYHFSAPRSFTIYEYGAGPTYYVRQTLPFPSLLFKDGYSVEQPAGNNVTLDPATGLLKGSIADTGIYVITISALEYRNNELLDSTMQDLFIHVYDCDSLPKPKASVPPINSCNDFTITFPNNSVPIYTNVNFSNTTFQWDFGDGSASSLTYPVHTYTDTGNYNVRLIIFPGLYCADTAFTNALVYPYLNPNFSYSDSCSDQSIQFINTSTSSGGTINSAFWQFKKDTSVLGTNNQYNASFTFNKAPQTYDVFLTVGTDKGCMATDSEFVNIWQSPYPLASHDTILSKGATLQLFADDGDKGFNAQFQWSPPLGLSSTTIADPILNSTTDNIYYVTIKNNYGCTETDSIRVKYYVGPQIYMPNAFTPNGDGKNDVLKPIPVGILTFHYFRVYNRYGQLMFETIKAFAGWDGYFHGSLAPAGTYVWETAGIDYNHKPFAIKGTVVLLR